MNDLIVDVKLWGESVGSLYWEKESNAALFDYERKFIRSGLDISPIIMPISQYRNTPYRFLENRTDCFKGLPGLFADSLPDTFGNQIINEWFASKGLSGEEITPLDRLCYVGKRGMGALEFEPSSPINGMNESSVLHIEELTELAKSVFTDRMAFQVQLRQEGRNILDILKVGTSAGGAKPKAIIAYNDITGEVRSGQVKAPEGFGYWLLKFDGGKYSEHTQITDNPQGIGNIEYAYHRMAKACGIDMMECRLLQEKESYHFMTRRFDRMEDGEKIHVQTLAGLAHYDRDQRHSYEEIFRIMRQMNLPYPEQEVQETIPTTQQLKDAFNLRMKDTSEEQQEETQISFWEVFDEFVKECGNQNNWTASTYEKFSAVKNHLKEFKEDVTFEYFNEFGLNEYVNFLRDKKDMRNSTIGKQMGFLKWFLRWSFKKGHHQNIAYDTFKPKLKTTSKKVIFLTWDELNRLKDYRIPKDKQYLERVRDVFLFCCFTSLRYSDVRNLKRSDVKPDHIEVTTVKTADSLIIELNDHSKTILEKYKEVHFENHMALPVISNQKMNDYLKELGELAEINEPVRETYYKGNERIDEVTPKYALLTTHAGRRTFICNALALGIPAQVVMKWTGHSDYKAMKPYIDIADDIKANAMNKFNQL